MHASAVLSDGVGIYTTQEDEYAKAISYLNGKYGEDALKDGKSLKDYVSDNGTTGDRELASLLGTSFSEPSFVIGEACNDNDPNTANDRYIDTNGTCHGNYIPVISSLSGWDSLDLGTTKSFSINASDTDGETLSYTYYVINVSNDNAIVSEQNIGNNSSFSLDIASPLFVSGNQYKIRIKASDGYNDAYFETTPPLDVVQASNINILANGTVTCPSATPQTMETKDGVEYYIALNKEDINSKINSGFRANNICTSHVTDISDLFKHNTSFNEPIGNWDTSNVTNMSFMFYEAAKFNQPIGKWDTSNVKNMRAIFANATSFNQPIGKWDTNNVTNMRSIFYGATSFNQDISNWKTGNVTDMYAMFYMASSFNQDISNWNTSHVTNMAYMFNYAEAFNQDISKWVTDNVIDYTNFASYSALTSANAPSKNETKFPTTK